MKNILFGFLFIILFTLLAGCHKAQRYEPKRIVVAGQVTDFNPDKHDLTLNMNYFDLLEEEPVTVLVNLKKDGSFRFECYPSFPQEIYLIYGSLIPLHVFPGDSIFVRIDPRLLELANDTTQTATPYDFVTANPLNNEFFAFNRKYDKEIFNWRKKVADSAATSDPFKYKNLVNEQIKEFQSMLKEYKTNHEVSKEFTRWNESSFKYLGLFELMRYWWVHAMIKSINEYDYLKTIPEDYYDFLKHVDLNMENVREDADTWGFLHEYYMYNLAFVSHKKEDQNKYFDNSQKQILENTQGELKQLTLARLYSAYLDFSDSVKLYKLLQSGALTDSYCISYLENKFRKTDSLIKHPTIPADAFLNETEKEVTGGLLDSLVSRNEGKVLYIDFWGTWCSACLEEMPYSKKLQDAFKGKDVAFIYLCCRSQENLWKAKISELKLAGSHYLLTNDQYNVMAGKFNITGLPHYVLIDRKGRIVDKNAPRPSDKSAMVKEMEKLLN